MSDNKNFVTELLAASMQAGGVVSRQDARETILIEDLDVPWVTLPDGSLFQLLQVDLNQNLWVVRNRLQSRQVGEAGGERHAESTAAYSGLGSGAQHFERKDG